MHAQAVRWNRTLHTVHTQLWTGKGFAESIDIWYESIILSFVPFDHMFPF